MVIALAVAVVKIVVMIVVVKNNSSYTFSFPSFLSSCNSGGGGERNDSEWGFNVLSFLILFLFFSFLQQCGVGVARTPSPPDMAAQGCLRS